jgi:hypothetical protein
LLSSNPIKALTFTVTNTALYRSISLFADRESLREGCAHMKIVKFAVTTQYSWPNGITTVYYRPDATFITADAQPSVIYQRLLACSTCRADMVQASIEEFFLIS